MAGRCWAVGEVASRDDRESLPGLRLIELAATLEPNDTVSVEFRRGKERKTVTVVTGDEPTIVFQGSRDGGAFVFRYRPDGPTEWGSPARLWGTASVEGPVSVRLTPRRPRAGPLNPDLGQYFGATTGVLVISVPKDSELGLKGGDVVLAVDGRKPASPSHLLRILRSYDHGESFKMDILRNRKRETLTSRLGEKGPD